MLMQKKTITSFFFIIFSLLFVNPISIKGIEYTSPFTEIGSIAPGIDIINARYIENDLAFLVEIYRGLAIYDTTDANNCFELDMYPLTFAHDIELDLERKLVYVTASTGVNIFNFSNPNMMNCIKYSL